MNHRPRPLAKAVRLCSRLDVAVSLLVLALALIVSTARPAHAMKIQSVKSPGGIEAWLVEEQSVPLIALRFAFEGGNAQDPAGKEGVANFLTAMLDEGAGELPSSAFQERMEELAMKMSYEDGKDAFYGNVEMLSANRDKSAELLKLAINQPRFDADAVERIRKQLIANLVYAARDPNKVAANAWYEAAFPGHPYGRPAMGTEETVAAIGREDLEAYRKRVFAKSNLKVVAVGDIDAATLGRMLDAVFGGLPEKAGLVDVPKTMPLTGGVEKIIEMDVPQSVAVFGLGSFPRKDPDFMPAFVLNHIIGGGGFSAKLMEEVREKRGLAYSVYTYLQPFVHTSILSGGVATKNESIAQSLDVIRGEFRRMAEQGPTEADLDGAKKYLVGSYALRFDTNAKIASQLLGIMQEGLGIDYVDKRNQLVEAVTMDDLKRVGRKLLKAEDLIVTVVGKPANMTAKGRS
jgi:zinc protease